MLRTLWCAGASLMFTFEKKTTWGLAYEAHGTGGLFAAVLSPMRGFGQFCLVVLALSVIANNVLNIYSVALSKSFICNGFFWSDDGSRLPHRIDDS